MLERVIAIAHAVRLTKEQPADRVEMVLVWSPAVFGRGQRIGYQTALYMLQRNNRLNLRSTPEVVSRGTSAGKGRVTTKRAGTFKPPYELMFIHSFRNHSFLKHRTFLPLHSLCYPTNRRISLKSKEINNSIIFRYFKL